MKKAISIIVLTISITILAYLAGFNSKQIISTTIFFLFIFSTLLFWRFRLAFAMMGIVALLLAGVLDVKNLLKFANFDIILFLIGMMTAVGFLEKRGFFQHIVNKMIRGTGENTKKLMFIMMLMSGFFGALIDEVTSILFMSSIMLQLISRYKLNPIPFILMIVFATNIGSSATVVGNPIGVLIAFKGGLTFSDFLRWATPISFIVLLMAIGICLLYFSKEIKELSRCMGSTHDFESEKFIPKEDIRISWIFISITMPLLIFHSVIEGMLNLEKNTMLLGAAFIAAGLALLIDRHEAKSLFERSVDWWTLVFFAFFFASVGTLKMMGTIDIVGKWMIDAAGGSDNLLFAIFTGATAALTPIVDNVLVVAIFIPIVENLSKMGFNDFPIWWGMLFAGTLFGNLTMIGSTANIVAIGMLESTGEEATLKEWIKAGAVVSITTLAVAILLLVIQFPFMPK